MTLAERTESAQTQPESTPPFLSWESASTAVTECYMGYPDTNENDPVGSETGYLIYRPRTKPGEEPCHAQAGYRVRFLRFHKVREAAAEHFDSLEDAQDWCDRHYGRHRLIPSG